MSTEKNRVGRLAARSAVVTGSSTGNGRAIALELAAEGASIVCCDLSKSVADAAKDADEFPDIDTDDLIRQRGGRAEFVRADVTSASDMTTVADHAVKSFGRLDVWVNNAGVGSFGALVDLPEETLGRDFAVNINGTWLGSRAAVRAFRGQERTGRSLGRIINMGSVAAEVGQGGLSSYATSKGAVHTLTRELAIELAPEYINVNAIAPGYFNTTGLNQVIRLDSGLTKIVEAKHPWPEMAPSSDLGRVAVFLASDDAAWITGVILPVDGGLLADGGRLLQ